MINGDAVSATTYARYERTARIGEAVQGLADYLADDEEDDTHAARRRPMASPRPTLGTVPPAPGPRPPVADVPPPGQAYSTGSTLRGLSPAGIFRHAALSPQQFPAANGQAAPSLPPAARAWA
ncbi:hypothetical protein [Microbispora siamensis]|uniref:Uncharacterized protein n=1 Tax=Microbispora siamensis TaxID=564413 RepID=A0ABQ4GRB7_9ACTN|nr:hypothetical protein [Microbispora siamensis]GIH63976.1 hypothetical protein Msi02_47930 [Microbispora siamensis]